MDKRPEMPVSEMDDRVLMVHALGVAYRDAERRYEEAIQQTQKTKRENQEMAAQIREMAEAYEALMKKNADQGEEARRQTDKVRRENKELTAQLREMTEAYQVLMKKNAELTGLLHKKQEEMDLLRRTMQRQPGSEKGQERGKDA